MAGVLVGADEKELADRADRLMSLLGVEEEGVGGRAPAGTNPSAWLDYRRPRWVIGTPDEARAMVARYEAAGCERLILQDFVPWDLDMVDLLGKEIVARA
jgi:alkanesulfonate monooxygenase SsuD/methylene tetrahydromethanopterin reductase-like flavin-dependent oxidoreductase (luciferase family)